MFESVKTSESPYRNALAESQLFRNNERALDTQTRVSSWAFIHVIGRYSHTLIKVSDPLDGRDSVSLLARIWRSC